MSCACYSSQCTYAHTTCPISDGVYSTQLTILTQKMRKKLNTARPGMRGQKKKPNLKDTARKKYTLTMQQHVTMATCVSGYCYDNVLVDAVMATSISSCCYGNMC